MKFPFFLILQLAVYVYLVVCRSLAASV